MASKPAYPFTSNPFTNQGSAPVQYRQQSQTRQLDSSPVMAAAGNQRPYGAGADAASPSTMSLLPPSAKGAPSGVQATFARAPPSLRSQASNASLIVRS